MTPQGLEARREIEAATQRLASAKTWAFSARKMWKSASKTAQYVANLEDAKKSALETVAEARSQLLKSEEEVIDAESNLQEVERRWEVIDIDGNPSSSSVFHTRNATDGNRKRQRNSEEEGGDTEHESADEVEVLKEIHVARNRSRKKKKALKKCYNCETVESFWRQYLCCGRCLKAVYCGKDCQRKHWKEHKVVCKQKA